MNALKKYKVAQLIKDKGISQENALQQLRELKKLDVNAPKVTSQKPNIENVKFTVVFDLPVDTNSNDFIMKLLQAATIVGSCGLVVDTTSFVLPKCMQPK